MNWGRSIIIVLAVFILFIAGMGVYMTSKPVDDYDHQYYEKGLAFDHDYNNETRVFKDHVQPIIKIVDGHVKLVFATPVKATISFLRPSNTLLDRSYGIDTGNGKEFDLPIEPIAKGNWQLVFNWKNNDKAYLYHQEVYIK